MKIQILRHYSVLLFICVCICVDHITLAQHPAVGNSSQVLTDTINISGIILDSNGRPAKNVFISRPWYQYYPSTNITTITDSMGKFHLNGIRFKDTLQIQTTNFSRQIINNGSRTLRITLPAVNEVVINKPVKIEAAEVSKKKPPTIASNPDCGEDYQIYMPKIEAQFSTAYQTLQHYITSNLVYPELALKNNIEGEVVIQFQISSDGTPNNFTIISGLNKECDQAALKVLMGMPKWRPAIFYGRLSPSTQRLAIEFLIKR